MLFTHEERMIRARTALIMSQPFFGTLALYLQLVADESIGTMATDGKLLIYAPSFIESITEPELQGVIVHEVMHCAYKHHLRRGKRDPALWNEAGDYCVNRDAIKAGFKLPKGALLDARYNGMGAEEIYVRLGAPKQQQPQQGQGQTQQGRGQPQQGQGQGQGQQPQQGQGQGQGQAQSQPQAGQGQAGGGNPSQGQAGGPTGGPGTAAQSSSQGTSQGQANGGQPQEGGYNRAERWGQVLDGVPEHNPAKTGEAEAEWDRRVRQAIATARAANAGKTPGTLEALVDALKKPVVDWREQVQRFFNDLSRFDYSWTRPNRRFLNSGFVLPSAIPDGVTKLGMVIDTSASIDEKLLAQFIAELAAVMDAGAVQELIVVHCDTKVQRVERFTAGSEIKIKPVGRGGTKFSPALAWFEQKEPDVAALIYFTDLESDDIGHDPGLPLLWAAYGHESSLNKLSKKIPFGEVIKVTRERL